MILLIGGPRDGQVVPEDLAGSPEYGRVDLGSSFTGMNVAVHMPILESNGHGLAFAMIIRWIAHCEDNRLLVSLFS